MQNRTLADDYLLRAGKRLKALEVLLREASFADVVREAQEIVELLLKAVLRRAGVELPRIHDVSDLLLKEQRRLPQQLQVHVERMAEISRTLRRDRELAYYGSEDLTPSEFYRESDATRAFADTEWLHNLCREALAVAMQTRRDL